MSISNESHLQIQSGKGKGKDGRVEKLEGTMTMQSITNRKEADVRGVQK